MLSSDDRDLSRLIYTFEFYRKYWTTIDDDVFQAVRDFFVNWHFPRGCNSSFIALIPKIQDAKFMKDFRPIRALDTHKLIPRRSPWQDVILAIHSLQSKGINLMDFIQKKVGNGENTSFWDDSWLGEVALKVLYKRLYALEMCKSISVAEKMGHPSLSHYFRRMPRGGVEQENYGLLCSKVADLVLPNISDRWCWSLEGSQEFSVKSSRILIDNTILPKAEVPTRWLRVVPIKVNVHAWRVCLDKLPTRANLSLRGMDIPSIACPLCNSAVESTSHIFFACPLARQVWRKFLIWYLLRDVVVNLALQKSIALWEFSTKACSLIR
ncbi:RNA-directed DNA polymerase, eukaryota, reverse transcriptase zinc-binding domain protein [Tanacetum coccineum]